MESAKTYDFAHFRQQDKTTLDDHLHHRHSVELVGMKRVGINNFLRFYLAEKYQMREDDHLYISVDLNDLIEREIFPFWRLMFKRIVDASTKAGIEKEIHQKISRHFSDAIQSGDLFLTYDGIRSSLELLSQANRRITIILTRFDRLKDVVTPEFFDNLRGLHAAAGRNLSYVFTTFRELEKLSPSIDRWQLSGFSHKMYMKPADFADSRTIFESLAKEYHLTLDTHMVDRLVHMSGGHVQYLRIILLVINDMQRRQEFTDDPVRISYDERVILQSEELWESLTHTEQEVLKKVSKKEEITSMDQSKAKYLWDTGFITQKNEIFSQLFANYLEANFAHQNDIADSEFSKKEYLLFTILKDNIGTITEREKIVESVWPEYKDFGVSDWSIDRLVARVRNKLRKQKSNMEIITVRTRGYKLAQV